MKTVLFNVHIVYQRLPNKGIEEETTANPCFHHLMLYST